MFLPGLFLFIMLVGMMTDYKFDTGTVVYYSIFAFIVIIYETVRYKRMFSKLDAVLKQIKELRGE